MLRKVLQPRLVVTSTKLLDGARVLSVKVKPTGISRPVYPGHTPDSKEINFTALPRVEQQTLLVNGTAKLVPNIAGATSTTDTPKKSLLAAMLEAAGP